MFLIRFLNKCFLAPPTYFFPLLHVLLIAEPQRRNTPSSSALDEPWKGPLNPKLYAVHNDYPKRWMSDKGQTQRFYSRSHLDDYQMSQIDRILKGSKTKQLLRKPGYVNSSSNYENATGQDMRSTLVLNSNERMEWSDGSEQKVLNRLIVSRGRGGSGSVGGNPCGAGRKMGTRGYFASARAVGLSGSEPPRSSQVITPW